ncbi:MAG: T9SS type A sorting domain-containing protein [Bacteroidaceae bacterium]
MRRFYRFFGLFLLLGAVSAQAQKTVYAGGYSVQSGTTPGIYKVTLDENDPAAFEQVIATEETTDGDRFVVAGTVAAGKYYAIQGAGSSYASKDYEFGTFDFENNTFSLIRAMTEVANYQSIGRVSDMTYDKKNKVLYAISTSGKAVSTTTPTPSTLFRIDPATGSLTKLADLAATLCGIAANANGELYCIGADPTYNAYRIILYKLTNNGGEYACEEVNTLNVKYGTTVYTQLDMVAARRCQSIEFDADGTLYWLARVKSGSFSKNYWAVIDLNSTEVTLKASLGNYRMVGLAFEKPSGEEGGSEGGEGEGGEEGGEGEGEEPAEPQVEKRVSVISTLGDAMGTSTSVTKREIYYYNKNNEIAGICLEGYTSSDNPDTEVVETPGFYPSLYTSYVYNDQDQLVEVRQRQYGTYDGYENAWNKTDNLIESYEYADNGDLKRKKTSNYAYDYTWEGKNLVSEVKSNVFTGAFSSRFVYSDFVDSQSNLPTKAKEMKTKNSTSYFWEYTYDEAKRMVARENWKASKEDWVLDENDQVIDIVTKGDPYQKETWEYDAEGNVTLYMKYGWKNTGRTNDDGSKIYDYIPTAKYVYSDSSYGRQEIRWSCTYNTSTQEEIWTKGAACTATAYEEYYGPTAPGNISTVVIEQMPNSLRLTCALPEQVTGNEAYKVFRNGQYVGTATEGEGILTYEDYEVKNGQWVYFIQTERLGKSYNVSMPVSYEFATELPAVTSVEAVTNQKLASGDYQLIIGWDAPAASSYTLKGYNVFVNVKSVTKNPTPVNGISAMTETMYEIPVMFTASTVSNKTLNIQVQAVYNIGKVMSEVFPITLSENMDPTSIEGPAAEGLLKVYGDQVVINGEYTSLQVYSVNGQLEASFSGQPLVDLAGLSRGIHLIKLEAGDNSTVLKLVKQ